MSGKTVKIGYNTRIILRFSLVKRITHLLRRKLHLLIIDINMAWMRQVPYVPTKPEVIDAMLKVANITKGDILYDLGCGDGRICITAAQKYGVCGVGLDISLKRITEAQENARRAGVAQRVRFLQQDFLGNIDISEATVVTLFLLPDINLKLRPKLLHELRPGTRIISNSFDMGDWVPEHVVEVGWRMVFCWIVP